jgi:hypothetical protein
MQSNLLFCHPCGISFLLRQVMEQDQAQAEKKGNEASQHPRSEVEWIIVGRVKTDGVESQCESESQRSDDDPPAQKRFVRF